MEQVQLRKAELSDAEGLAACIDAAYEKYQTRILDMPSVSEGCAEEISSNQVWVAILDGRIVGGLFLIPNDGFMKLANLAVHPAHGGKGIGGRLMELAEQTAREQGLFELRLNTHVAMPENVELYTHLGWREISRGGNTVSMSKRLETQ